MSQIANPDFAASVTASFNRQNAMQLIRATLPVVEHGRTEIHVPHWEGIEQQHGFVHGGVVGMIADSATGYAAMTMVPADASVLAVDETVNLEAKHHPEPREIFAGQDPGQDPALHRISAALMATRCAPSISNTSCSV